MSLGRHLKLSHRLRLQGINRTISALSTICYISGPNHIKVGLKLNIQKTKIMASGPITSWEIDGRQWKQCQTLFFLRGGAPNSLQMVTAAMKLKDTYSLEGEL